MSLKPKCYSNYKTEISHTLKYHQNRKITKTEMSSKLKCHKTDTSPKLKCHWNGNVTKTKIT